MRKNFDFCHADTFHRDDQCKFNIKFTDLPLKKVNLPIICAKLAYILPKLVEKFIIFWEIMNPRHWFYGVSRESEGVSS